MKPELVFTLLFSFISTWKLVSLEAKVFVVLMEDDPVVMMSLRNDENIAFYKERMTREHDIFLESLLEKGSYIKLYSYTHLLNGFAIYSKDKKVKFYRVSVSDR
ncbi:Chromodomain helicase hrp1 [Olea europaea subsp. europaea]|uniref:Chromodomain helicase hrp1 n=1 Tax=Olea europaea subsp. europaea TaxID=158383 RepID=A0A8S0R5E6_OLEEU|nr:Chromodomain helicase hrp1 [Olea europaea subsp. europaea]